MKLIEQKRLHFKEGNSDKVYEVDLCELGAGQYTVNFRFGKRGASLKEGTKTPEPVALDQARKLFEGLVSEKTKKGYTEADEAVLEGSFKRSTNPDPVQARRENLLENLRLAADSLRLYAEKRRWSPKRMVWRVGQEALAEALSPLIELLPKGDQMQRYCTVWALGRCGAQNPDTSLRQTAAQKLLEALSTADYPAMLRPITASSLSLLLAEGGAEQVVLIQRLKESLPTSFQTMLKPNQVERLEAVLADYRLKRQGSNFDFVHELYLLARFYPWLRRAVLDFVSQAPLEGGFFRSLRRIYKSAEQADDAAVLGIFGYRLERSGPTFKMPANKNKWIWYKNRSYNRAELKKDNSVLAFSSDTHRYFKARLHKQVEAWQQTGHAAYLKLAVAWLCAYDDKRDKGEIGEDKNWTYDTTQKRWISEVRFTDYYANALGLHHFLRRNSNRYAWDAKAKLYRCQGLHYPGQPLPEGLREEALPELWDAQPLAYMQLLMESKAEAVFEFAWQRLKAHPQGKNLMGRLQEGDLSRLLQSPLTIAQRFALSLLQERYAQTPPPGKLVLVLLDSQLPELREQGLLWLDGQKESLLQQAPFVKTLLTHSRSDLRRWMALALPQVLGFWPAERRRILLTQLLAHLQGLSAAGLETEICPLLQAHYAEELKGLNLDLVQDFLLHPLQGLSLFGVELLQGHRAELDRLPKALLKKLLADSRHWLRAAAANILRRQSLMALEDQQETLWEAFRAAHEDAQVLGEELMLRLAEAQPENAQYFALRLAQTLLHKPQTETEPQRVLAFLQRPALAAVLHILDRSFIFRLLNSERRGAQDLGAILLQRYIKPESLSVSQLIRLANHELLAARQVAWEMFQAQIPRMRYEAEEALRLLDAKWEDSRQFAMRFFRQNFEAKDWNPELLVSICDASRLDVQAFGREMLARFFDEAQGEDYLLKLAQHPRPEMQLYASNYLERFASDNLAVIKALEFYFTSVLCRVNQGRTVKNRVFKFIHQEGLKSIEAARLIAPLLEKLSATVALGDKSRCLSILRDLRRQYPDLPLLPEFELYEL